MYGETIAGVTVSRTFSACYTLSEYSRKIVRAFGASTKFLRDMQQHVDTVCFAWLKFHGSHLILACFYFPERYSVMLVVLEQVGLLT